MSTKQDEPIWQDRVALFGGGYGAAAYHLGLLDTLARGGPVGAGSSPCRRSRRHNCGAPSPWPQPADRVFRLSIANSTNDSIQRPIDTAVRILAGSGRAATCPRRP